MSGILKGMYLDGRTTMNMTFEIDGGRQANVPWSGKKETKEQIKDNTEIWKDEEEEFRQRLIQEKGVIIIGVELSFWDLFVLMIKSSIAFLPMFLVVFFIFALIAS